MREGCWMLSLSFSFLFLASPCAPLISNAQKQAGVVRMQWLGGEHAECGEGTVPRPSFLLQK